MIPIIMKKMYMTPTTEEVMILHQNALLGTSGAPKKESTLPPGAEPYHGKLD